MQDLQQPFVGCSGPGRAVWRQGGGGACRVPHAPVGNMLLWCRWLSLAELRSSQQGFARPSKSPQHWLKRTLGGYTRLGLKTSIESKSLCSVFILPCSAWCSQHLSGSISPGFWRVAGVTHLFPTSPV